MATTSPPLARIRSAPFALSLSGIGRFDRRNGGALWAGVAPKAPVTALAARIGRACITAGLAPERRTFHPHITLARYNRRSAAAADALIARNRALASPAFEVAEFTLYQSHLSRHGAQYEAVASYKLE